MVLNKSALVAKNKKTASLYRRSDPIIIGIKRKRISELDPINEIIMRSDKEGEMKIE